MVSQGTPSAQERQRQEQVDSTSERQREGVHQDRQRRTRLCWPRQEGDRKWLRNDGLKWSFFEETILDPWSVSVLSISDYCEVWHWFWSFHPNLLCCQWWILHWKGSALIIELRPNDVRIAKGLSLVMFCKSFTALTESPKRDRLLLTKWDFILDPHWLPVSVDVSLWLQKM